MTIYKLAWRNLWRNKRRTLITVASVFFGVILCALMGSMQEGQYSNMIDNIIKFYAGHMQIQHTSYRNNRTINNTIQYTQYLKKLAINNPEIALDIPRLENFALAAYGNTSSGAITIGIEPQKEDAQTGISKRIIEGKYLSESDHGVLLGSELARKLKVFVGDTIVLLGQGYHGISAAGKFEVKGILKHTNPSLNKQLVLIHLKQAQTLFSAPNMVTSVSVMLHNKERINAAMAQIRHHIAPENVVLSWAQLYPNIVQQIDSDRSTALVTKFILYVVIAFGIFSTLLMMMAERKHEFGVMVACGMPRHKLALTLMFETILIGIIGALLGIIGAIFPVSYLVHNPIPIGGHAGEWMLELGFEPYILFSMHPMIFINQMLVVLIMTWAIGLFPYVKTFRLNEVVAIRD